MKKTLVILGIALSASAFGQQTQVLSRQCPSDPFANVPSPYWVSEVNKLFIDCPQVRVGIGNSSPQAKLDVTGGIIGSTVLIGQDPYNADGRLHINSQLPATNSNNVMVVENNDRRILQLDNTGLLRSREVLVDAQAWPDYVFEDDYQLMTLSETESYINTNGHLPNVPSAEEVEQNGQELGAMNKILLEKIEELTLHLIDQQKQIEELKEQIKK